MLGPCLVAYLLYAPICLRSTSMCTALGDNFMATSGPFWVCIVYCEIFNNNKMNYDNIVVCNAWRVLWSQCSAVCTTCHQQLLFRFICSTNACLYIILWNYTYLLIIIQTGAHLHHRCVPTAPITVQITLGYTCTQALYTHA